VRARAAIPQAVALARASRAAARAYGYGPVAAARRLRRARREGAWEYAEALGAGLLAPGCTDEVRRGLVSYTRLQAAQLRHNPLALEPLTEHKVICDRYLAALGVRCAELYGTVGRHGGWAARTGAAVDDREAFAEFVARELPPEWIVKPAQGLLGLGVRLVRRLDDGSVDAGEGPIDPRALFDALEADPDFDQFVVQERLRNHPAIEALTGSTTLQTLRLSTFVRRDGGVHLMCAMFKLAIGSGPADNFRKGDTGNGLADVDADGRLGPLQVLAACGHGHDATPFVPGTDRRVEGFRVPFFADARRLVTAAAPSFLPMRTLGWDIGITPDGPAVVEANNYWGPPFTPMAPESRMLLAT
jgi:hypothetical protein